MAFVEKMAIVVWIFGVGSIIFSILFIVGVSVEKSISIFFTSAVLVVVLWVCPRNITVS